MFTILFFNTGILNIEVQLISSVSSVQLSDSAIYIYIFFLRL